MRRYFFLACLVLVPFPAAAKAGDHPFLDRFVQRTPVMIWPTDHTMERAGYPLSIRRHAIPSMTRYDYPGYIGGASILNNRLVARGPLSATGPLEHGTFGTDFGGFRGHLGRVFLATSDNPAKGLPFSWGYRQNGPRVTDVIALRPLRKAILEKREDVEERKHGGEGHGGH